MASCSPLFINLVAVPEAAQGWIQKIFLRVGLYFNDKGVGLCLLPLSDTPMRTPLVY